MEQQKAAMWYDATVGASVIDDPKSGRVAGKLGFAPAPVNLTKNSGWLVLGAGRRVIVKHKAAAWTYLSLGDLEAYISTRASSWAGPACRRAAVTRPTQPSYQKAAHDFATATLDQISSVSVSHPGVSPQPYVGVQYVGIPEFEDLGTKVSQEITAAIAGQETVAQALSKSQGYAAPVGQTYK
jgi:sorbitol/mannitol transport system substrate-binding protein